jgi:hypothetical protein
MNGRYTGHGTDTRAPRLRLIRLLQIRLSRLMLLVAVVAVLSSAWMYHWENRSDDRAWTSSQILALNDSDVARRRQAAENIYRVELADLML